VRSLEKRLGTKLLDRSGRRVEPTEAGQRLYRAAQRMLSIEGQLFDEVAAVDGVADLRGDLTLGASTGPGGTVVPLLLCEFQREHPQVHVELSISDTNRIIEQVADRDLELGVVGAAPRHRGVVFEPFFRDEVILVVPPAHPAAGKQISLDALRSEPLILMQEGAGVRQVIEEELRHVGVRLRDLDVRLELGLQESVKSAVAAGFGITFISRSGVEAELAAGTLAAARVKGLEPSREISLVRAAGRSTTRAADAFVDFARARLPA
jgi:DNA-binding transcriptional LysR family regulator